MQRIKFLNASNKNIIFLFLPLLSFVSCVNLTHVGKFATTAESGIKNFEAADYTYEQHCEEACRFKMLSRPVLQREDTCDCRLYALADSVAMTLYHTLRIYFHGLGELASEDANRISFDTLRSALTEGNFAGIEIKKEDAGAYTNIANILVNAGATAWKKKKLSQFIGDADQPLQVLISKFIKIIGNLELQLDFRKEILFNHYYKIHADTQLSQVQKQEYAGQYYHQLAIINKKQAGLKAFAGLLNEIAEAHHKLSEKRNEINKEEIKKLLKEYEADYRRIQSEINKLKK